MGYGYVLWAVAVAVVIYLALQHVDDERNRRQGKPLAGWGSRTMLGFLVLMVCLVVFYMLFGMAQGNPPRPWEGGEDGLGGAVQAAEVWYKSIPEDIRVGLPGF